MDPKAAAKSKRSHSLQGKRNSLPSSAHNSDKKKPQKQQQQQQGGEQPPRPPRPSLPSNWDRYEDEGDAEMDQRAEASVEGGAHVLMPKSKGADFGYLIEQARSQPRDAGVRNSTSLFDDSVPDFIRGLSPMLSARGKNLLSWCADDNFIVDDDTSSSFEVPLLSLDLDALAAQLAKLKLSQRLFIDARYIPEEMDTDVSNKTSMQELGPKCEESPKKMESINSSVLSGQHRHADDKRKIASDENRGSLTTERHGLFQKRGKEDFCPPSSSKVMKESHTSDLDAQSFTPSMLSRFEATAAESELDMLLDSFGETNFFDSSKQLVARDLSVHEGGLPSKTGSSSSSYAVKTGSIDSTVDDLLAVSKPLSSSSTNTRNTTQLGAPLSRHLASTACLDGTIDDLLAETSADTNNQKNISHSGREREPTSSNDASLSSNFVSKALDDFDSWLDTF